MTAGDLHDLLMETGAELLKKTVLAIETGDYKEVPQSSFKAGELKHAPKIFKEDCKIDWNQNTETVFNLIKGLSPYPSAFTSFLDKGLKIYGVEKDLTTPTVEAGKYLSDGKTYLKIATNDGYIILKDIQQEGKKRMLIEDFLRGIRL